MLTLNLIIIAAFFLIGSLGYHLGKTSAERKEKAIRKNIHDSVPMADTIKESKNEKIIQVAKKLIGLVLILAFTNSYASDTVKVIVTYKDIRLTMNKKFKKQYDAVKTGHCYTIIRPKFKNYYKIIDLKEML